eukprot:SAG11_NODE_17992_length_503_cov_0.514851_2_plen_65_part_01
MVSKAACVNGARAYWVPVCTLCSVCVRVCVCVACGDCVSGFKNSHQCESGRPTARAIPFLRVAGQ